MDSLIHGHSTGDINNDIVCRYIDCQAPDSKVHGGHIGPIWGREDPGGHHVAPMNFATWGRITDASKENIFCMFTWVCISITYGW